MIKVTYENEESGQTATFTVEPEGDESIKVSAKFDPCLSDDTKDQYGVLRKVFDALTTL